MLEGRGMVKDKLQWKRITELKWLLITSQRVTLDWKAKPTKANENIYDKHP